MRLAQALEAYLADTVGQAEEARLHIRGKTGDFTGDCFVQDFNPPWHVYLYLNFEI
jgi:hypothetical protein